MATEPNNIFNFVYRVEIASGGYRLIDSNGKANNGVPAVSVNAVVKDETVDGVGDDKLRLGDVGTDRFTATIDGTDAVYTFETAASPQGGGGTGFIATDANGRLFFFTDTQYSGGEAEGQRKLNTTSNDQTICFMPGTAIATPDGTAPVEQLAIGDLVVTSDGRTAPVRWIGRQTVSTLFADETRLPVRITAGALGENVPCRDLLVSNDHALLIEGVLVQAGALINGATIVRERDVPSVFTYHHVELDDHSLILAENVPAETFVDNVERTAFDNWAEYQALYPNGRSVPEMDRPRVKAQRQLPSVVRRLIASRTPANVAASAA